MQRASTSPPNQVGAAAVHIYTASGAVVAFLIVLAAFAGQIERALWLGLLALIIDSTDGTLARRFRVSEALPMFDGGRLDDIVDYLTYVFAPVVLLWLGGFLPEGTTGLLIAIAPLLASSYQFCRVDAKTDDHYFLGFPSYWNVVAFYVIVFGLSPAVVSSLLLVCSLLVFVPVRYLYPSRTVTFRKLTLALTAGWMLVYAGILLQMPEPSRMLTGFSVLYLAYYVAMSLYLTVRGSRARN